MRALIIAAATLALAGCSNTALQDKQEHSDVVAVCRDGTHVLRDPADGALTTLKYTGYVRLSATVAPGVTAAEVCK